MTTDAFVRDFFREANYMFFFMLLGFSFKEVTLVVVGLLSRRWFSRGRARASFQVS